jgi:hypothetical protein
MTGIFQTALPYDVAAQRPLPGIAPLAEETWLLADEAFAAQMAERTRLLAHRRAEVVAMRPEGRAAADELLQFVLDWLAAHGAGYRVFNGSVVRPDGVSVPVNRDDPLGTLGHLVQEDLCLMQKLGDEHVLTAAVLCFPASWRLADKIGRPLTAIHTPVAAYDADIARRVQRLFDGVRVGRPLWRFNVLGYALPDLHQPGRLGPTGPAGGAFPYLRSERQCVLRLPRTGACVFSIHTFVLRQAQPAAGTVSRSMV